MAGALAGARMRAETGVRTEAEAGDRVDAPPRGRAGRERAAAPGDLDLETDLHGMPPNGSHGTGRNGTGSTRVASRFSPRRDVNPAGRRRSVATLAFAFAVLGALAVAAIVLTAPATVRLPRLRGLSKARATSTLNGLHLHALFVRQFDNHARKDTVVSQSPDAGTQVKEGTTIEVALSRGPAPIPVPRLIGQQSGAATAQLHRINLNASVTLVAAPGAAPGVVTGQDPAVGHVLRRHQTVTLTVAETPRWQTVTSFNGQDAGHSSEFKIRGPQWRIVYTMSYQGTCNFVLFCNGPSAQVLGPGATTFDLSSGSGQTKVFKSGPGLYQINIHAGWDSARWSFEVQDWL
jgi:PASTA domain